MNLVFENSFTIMPRDCNYMMPMIFGGAFFSQLDLTAACCVDRLLHDSECDSAVTHMFEGTFHKPTYAGDTIYMRAEIVELRHKAVVVKVRAERERRAQKGREHVADAKFVFVTRKDGNYHPHGLSLNS